MTPSQIDLPNEITGIVKLSNTGAAPNRDNTWIGFLIREAPLQSWFGRCAAADSTIVELRFRFSYSNKLWSWEIINETGPWIPGQQQSSGIIPYAGPTNFDSGWMKVYNYNQPPDWNLQIRGYL